MHINKFTIWNQYWVRKATKLLNDAGCPFKVVLAPINAFYAHETIVIGDKRVTPTGASGIREIRELIASL